MIKRLLYAVYHSDDHLIFLLRGYEEGPCRFIDGDVYIELTKLI